MDPKPEWHCRIGRVARKGGGATVRVLPPAQPNWDAVAMVEVLLARLKSGQSVAAAIVDVGRFGTVATGWSPGPHYHFIQSGAAILAARLGAMS